MNNRGRWSGDLSSGPRLEKIMQVRTTESVGVGIIRRHHNRLADGLTRAARTEIAPAALCIGHPDGRI